MTAGEPDSSLRLALVARVCAVGTGLIAALALAGYGLDATALAETRLGMQAMSPVTSAALLCLAVALLEAGRRYPGRWLAAITAALAAAALASHALFNADRLSPAIGQLLFPGTRLQGRTSVATAASLLLLAAAVYWRGRRPRVADGVAGVALVVASTALLGYLYGVQDLYALAPFNSMALNTAGAILLASVAAIAGGRGESWAGVIGSDRMGGGATRRQLSLLALPIAAGYLLLRATEYQRLGPAMALALLVVVTVVPIALLILRDGRLLNALDEQKRLTITGQARAADEMATRLARQADALELEGIERLKAEAAMARAQRIDAVGQLTGGIAHDFNNLLMAIRGNLELLQRRLPADDERVKRFTANALSAVEKGAKLTGQLLTFSRIQKLDIRSVEIDRVIAAACTLIGPSLGPGVTLIARPGAPDVWARTDPDQLELAVLNLAVNARDAMPGGGTITVETRPGVDAGGHEHVTVRVRDEGSGMSPEVAARAVEPFFTTKKRGEGTGLGLAQVYGFVRQSGGELTIVSAPGEGTMIDMAFPRVAAAAPAGDAGSGEGEARRPGQGQRIVIVDDDDGVRTFMAEALSDAGFAVTQAADGARGVAAIAETRPAMAVIDFLMPGMDGAEVARQARLAIPGLPIVFVSGYGDTAALDSVGDARVLRKPFTAAALTDAVAVRCG